MNERGRAESTLLNSLAGMAGQIISVIFSFVSRTFFIRYLGTEYLGYDALFSSILTVLSVVDLGITSSLTYALYGYLHNKDMEKVAAIISYFRKIFYGIGISLIAASVLISPFIPFFVSSEYTIEINFFRILFILYAFSSFSSYFFVDMRTLLTADQHEYIISVTDCISKIIARIIQIITIVLFQNYILYVTIELFVSFFGNIIISVNARKRYQLKIFEEKYKLSYDEKKEIFSNVFYISLNKVANTGITSTDNIIISKFVSTILLGVYSNYNLVLGTGYALIDKLIIGATASLGNLFAGDERHRQEQVILNLQFLDSIFSSLVFIFLYNLVPDVIYIWLGTDMMLGNEIIFVVCFNYYLYMTRKTLDLIMQAKGVFKEIVPIKLLEMVVNLIVSIGLAISFGMIGVFLGTTISILISYIMVSKKLINDIFAFRYCIYVLSQIKYFIVNIIAFIVIWRTLLLFDIISIPMLLLKLLIGIIEFIGINLIFYIKNPRFKELFTYLSNIYYKYFSRE